MPCPRPIASLRLCARQATRSRKRGEVVRTRTVIRAARIRYPLLGTFGGQGLGDYRGELQRAIEVIKRYATQHELAPTSLLVRKDLPVWRRRAPSRCALGKSFRRCEESGLPSAGSRSGEMSPGLPARSARHPSAIRGMTRALYDCASVPLTATGPAVRLVIATHPARNPDPAVGVERDGIVYEFFVSTLPSKAVTASDILDLYMHRGSFETVLADEDKEQEMDRWYSHTPCGQEFAQILAQWVWNLRGELGQQLSPSELRTRRFCSRAGGRTSFNRSAETCGRTTSCGHVRSTAMGSLIIYAWVPWLRVYAATRRKSAMSCKPSPVSARTASRAGWFRCSVLYAARIGHCRACPRRPQCQESSATIKPRQVSAVLWPLSSSHTDSSPAPDPASAPRASAPVLWRDWPRCSIRRTWLKVVRSQTVCLEGFAPLSPPRGPRTTEKILTRAERAHWRLRWRPAAGAQCSSSGCPQTDRHASWTPSSLCRCLWL